jgi:hypothetical protein
MNNRVVVTVASGEHYQKGARRLTKAAYALGEQVDRTLLNGRGEWPHGWPSHTEKPYAFKAYALKEAADFGFDQLLWCDACIYPLKSIEPIWQHVAEHGVWLSRNGYNNYEWTADSAYPTLFPEWFDVAGNCTDWAAVREINRAVEHVVATAFAVDVRHPVGKEFMREYFRLASETNAFCGPWINANHGPGDVRGHRHDQTSASVIAWRLGVSLTNPPRYFAYGKVDAEHDDRTILLADGSY